MCSDIKITVRRFRFQSQVSILENRFHHTFGILAFFGSVAGASSGDGPTRLAAGRMPPVPRDAVSAQVLNAMVLRCHGNELVRSTLGEFAPRLRASVQNTLAGEMDTFALKQSTCALRWADVQNSPGSGPSPAASPLGRGSMPPSDRTQPTASACLTELRSLTNVASLLAGTVFSARWLTRQDQKTFSTLSVITFVVFSVKCSPLWYKARSQ